MQLSQHVSGRIYKQRKTLSGAFNHPEVRFSARFCLGGAPDPLPQLLGASLERGRAAMIPAIPCKREEREMRPVRGPDRGKGTIRGSGQRGPLRGDVPGHVAPAHPTASLGRACWVCSVVPGASGQSSPRPVSTLQTDASVLPGHSARAAQAVFPHFAPAFHLA